MSADLSGRVRRPEGVAASAAPASPPIGEADPTAGVSPADGGLRLGRSQPFDFDWKFHLGADEEFSAPGFDDGAWRVLDLPHDWSIEDLRQQEGSSRVGPFDPESIGAGATGFTVGGEGWYRKHFDLNGLPPQARVEIEFGGVYDDTEIWLNGVSVGRHVHGYTPFRIDLTQYLRSRGNLLAVRVRNLGKNSRWYSGSGIYRSVTVDVLPEPARVAQWGVAAATTRISGGGAEISVNTRIEQPDPGLTLVSRLRGENGVVVAEQSSPAGAHVGQTLTVASPRLWSPDEPALYVLETELRRGENAIDRLTTPFGIRIVTFDAKQGMMLNGKPTKLRGGCVHHDNGILGAAAHPDAEERRIRLLKARGYNAIRSSHNPASRAFIDACDRVGMLLIQEAFDMWEEAKNPQDYAAHFTEWAEVDMSTMVLSSRNHASVIMWSIGNEISGRLSPRGIEIAWTLANLAHRLDPTRPVTAGINGYGGRPLIADAMTARKGFAGVPDEASSIFLDVVGCNYKLDRYAADHASYPGRVMYGSESFPREVFDAWAFIETHPYVIGDFVWTAMDYLGEAGIGAVVRNTSKVPPPPKIKWPWVNANCGDVDIVGAQKPQSFARDVVWGLSPLEIAVQRPMPDGMFEHVSPWGWSDELQSWTWPGAEGQLLMVRAYTSADRVEVRLNGDLVEQKAAAGAKGPIEFRVPYAPGKLEAIAFRAGREVGRRRLETTGRAEKVRLTVETPLRPVRGALAFVGLKLVDAEGRHVRDAVKNISLSLTGPARLMAFGSATPMASDSFQSTKVATFDGRALAVLRSNGLRDTVRLTATGSGLEQHTIDVCFA